jgi:hypothetical protein
MVIGFLACNGKSSWLAKGGNLRPERFLEKEAGYADFANGGLAQLGERLAGSQKVSGSSPLSST